jgi:hypothetical protein
MLLPLLLFAVAGLAMKKRKPAAASASSTTGASSSARPSSSATSSATPPVWTPGPGNAGRIYGSSSFDAPPTLWQSNKVLVGPDCSWVIEGDAFLPVGGASSGHLPTLADALVSGDGWAFVDHLVNFEQLGAAAAADRVMREAAQLWAQDPDLPDASACVVGRVVPSSPVGRWRTDLQQRISAGLSSIGDRPIPTATFVPPAAGTATTFVPPWQGGVS